VIWRALLPRYTFFNSKLICTFMFIPPDSVNGARLYMEGRNRAIMVSGTNVRHCFNKQHAALTTKSRIICYRIQTVLLACTASPATSSRRARSNLIPAELYGDNGFGGLWSYLLFGRQQRLRCVCEPVANYGIKAIPADATTPIGSSTGELISLPPLRFRSAPRVRSIPGR